MRSSKIGQDGPSLRAGWYSDPESALVERWWNGSQWTSHTRTADSTGSVVGSFDQPPLAWSAASGPLATLPPDQTGTTMFVPGEPVYGAYPPPFVPSPSIAPGWYPDPNGLPIQRWWDGGTWSANTAPLPDVRARSYPLYPPTVVAVSPPKSVGVALVLTFFFGPFGMLYSTVSGALIMLAISFFGGIFVGILTFGLAWLIWGPAMWLTSMIWGCLAAERQRATVLTRYR